MGGSFLVVSDLFLKFWGSLAPLIAKLKQLSNVYYDTAATPLLYRPDVYQAVINAVGSEKILFGSDYPLLIYPSQDREPGFSRFLQEIRESGLLSEELNLVLGDNAARLLGL